MSDTTPTGWRAGPRDRRRAPAPEPEPVAPEPVAPEPEPEPEQRSPLDLASWPCGLCSHGHYPGEPCTWSRSTGQPCGCRA